MYRGQQGSCGTSTGILCTSIWGPADGLRQYFFITRNWEYEPGQTHDPACDGTAQMPTGWPTKGIRTFARSADAHTSCRWSLPHALLKLCHLMPLCGHLWALCCASSQLLGAGTNKDFWIATSTKDKDTNYTGIQQQLICFHASVTTRYMEDNFRASCPVPPA